MKKAYALTLLLSLLLLSGCGGENISVPESPELSAKTPQTEQTTSPSPEPESSAPAEEVGSMGDAPPWSTEEPDYQSYEDYFAQTIAYEKDDIRGRVYFDDPEDEDISYTVTIEDGRIRAYTGSRLGGDRVDVWEVPKGDYSNCELWFVTNTRIYAVENKTELFSINYWGEERETLFIAEDKLIFGISDSCYDMRMSDVCLFFLVVQKVCSVNNRIKRFKFNSCISSSELPIDG